jgi:beta-galactosidase
MDNGILFGAAYYPEYLPDARTEIDIAMMKSAGMNTVRIAESTWSTEEPQDGVFDFSYIDSVLDVLQKNDMHAIIGTPTYAVPSWLVKKDPSIMITRKKEQAVYGPRQSMDFLNPLFRFHADRIIRRLVDHTAAHPAVCGFQLDNETKHYGNYGPYAQQLFRNYLQKKFKTTETFNRTFGLAYWSNSISCWDDFPDLRGCINGNLVCEYEKFLRTCAARYLQWQANIVAEYKRPDQFITHNFDFEWRPYRAGITQDSYSYGVQPDINHAEASKAVTIAGADIYHPTQDNLTGAEIAFCGDEIRSLKGTNYLVIETEAQGFKHWTPYPGQLRLQAYSHLASGADGMMYWSWQSIHHSFETYWKGLLSHDLASNPTYEEACRFGAEWKRLGAQLIHLRKENRVALVTDNLSLSALDHFPIDRNLSYNDVVRWMYDSLYEMNVECDVVDIHELDPALYRLIVTPALYCISEKNSAKLNRFVSDGGVLVSSFKSFFSDETAGVYHDTQPHLMTDCFGMHYSQFTEPVGMTLGKAACSCFAELLVSSGAETVMQYEHPYWSRYAGCTKNVYGKGTAYYIGAYTEKTVLKDLYRQALESAGLLSGIPACSWPVIIRSGTNATGKKLHYLFNYSRNRTTLPCPYTDVTDLLTGMQYKGNNPVVLADWDVKILRENR